MLNLMKQKRGWIFVKDCDYLTPEKHTDLVYKCNEVGKMIGSMLKNTKSFVTSK